MSFDYNDARETALELITEFGQHSKVVKKGATGGTDAFGNPLEDVHDQEVGGIVTPLLQYNSREVNGESIRTGDCYVFFHSDSDIDDWFKYLFAPIANNPELNLQITINGVTFRIVEIYSLDSVDDINVFRKLQLRR